MSSGLGAETPLRASNELCSFTAGLMETSGDLSLSVCVCESSSLPAANALYSTIMATSGTLYLGKEQLHSFSSSSTLSSTLFPSCFLRKAP